MPFETVVLKTAEYLKIPSVVGFEQHFLNYLKNDFEQLGLTTTMHKGLLEVSGQAPFSNIITAHTDRHGLLSLPNNEYAYAAEIIKQRKYDEDSKATRQTLDAIRQRFVGEDVIAYNPETGETIAEGTIQKVRIDQDDHIFSIFGLSDLDQNTPVAYARSTEVLDDYLKGQIDNVVSLGLIYVLYQNGYQGTALLTTEEEIGKSWRYLNKWLDANAPNNQNLFVLDTSPYRENKPIKEHLITLRYRDKSGVFNKDLTDKIMERCDNLSLPYQVKDQYFLDQGLEIKDLGSTELGRLVMETQGNQNGCTIQVPTTEYHTSYETTSKGCIENVYRLLSDILLRNPL